MHDDNPNIESSERQSIRPDIPGIRDQENAGNHNGPTSNNLLNAESSPWKNSISPSNIIKHTGVGEGLSAANKVKSLFWGSSNRRKGTIGGGIVGGVAAIVIVVMTVLSGPGQLLQLDQVLQNNFNPIKHATSNRFSKLMKNALSSNKNDETETGQLAASDLKPTLEDFSKVGITFNDDESGKASINTEKLSEKFPELDNMSEEERSSWLQDKFSLNSDEISSTDSGKTFTVNSDSFPDTAASTLFADDTPDILSDGNVLSSIGNRVFSGMFGVSNLFHQFNDNNEKESETTTEATSEVEENEQSDLESTEDSTEAVQADSNAEDETNDHSVLDSLSALNITSGACHMYQLADDIDDINKFRIMLPSVVEALRFISIGEQIKSGQDIKASTVNALLASLSNSKSQSIWGGTALQATEGDSHLSGTDLSTDYKQAFTGSSTADSIKSYTKPLIPISPSFTCSWPVQSTLNIGSVAVSIGGAVFSDGADTVAESSLLKIISDAVGTEAIAQAKNQAITIVAAHFIDNFILNKATLGKLAKDAFSGPAGGDLLAYGARSAADLGGAVDGLVPLSNTESSIQTAEENNQSEQQFKSEGIFARLFDINDYRSLIGKLADSFSPSLVDNMSDLSTDFMHMGSILPSSLANLFLPKTSAANQYYWGIKTANAYLPQYGLPDSVLNGYNTSGKYDASMANPYTNSDDVAKLLDTCSSNGTDLGECSYISQAQTCFGVDITNTSGVWNVTADNVTADSTATNIQPVTSSCATQLNTDNNWRRIVLFILDTRTMQAADCYDTSSSTSDQSCSDIGYGNNNSTSSSSSSPSAYFTVKGNKIYEQNGKQYIPYGISVVDDLDQANWCNYEAATDAQIQAAAKYWNVNSIRLQVSEANFEGSGATCNGQSATQRLIDEINEIESLNKIPIINDNNEYTGYTPGPTTTTEQFWNTVTSALNNQSNTEYSNVIFDIFNEPDTEGTVWQKGGVYKSGSFPQDFGKTYLGMQDIVNSIRNGSNLNNNLIMVEGHGEPNKSHAASLSQLQQYQISGSDIAYAFHHVNLNASESTWKDTMGLNTGLNVPIIDGEWAQYASGRAECYNSAPQNTPTFLNLLKSNDIGLIFWSLEPGVGTTASSYSTVSDTITSNFPTAAEAYSNPTTFKSDYSCSGDPSTKPLVGQGAGKLVMDYFKDNNQD